VFYHAVVVLTPGVSPLPAIALLNFCEWKNVQETEKKSPKQMQHLPAEVKHFKKQNHVIQTVICVLIG